MPRFILIDQSLRGIGGHNDDYARQILAAAVRIGLAPVLASNRAYRGQPDPPCRVCRVFRYGSLDRPPALPRPIPKFVKSLLGGRAAAAPPPAGGAPAASRATALRDRLGRLRQGIKVATLTSDLRRLFSDVGLEDGDLVFVPMMEPAELPGLLDFLRRTPASTRATWHLLFRRDLNECGGPSSATDPGLTPDFRHFRRFHAGLSGHRVFYHTDTDRLAAEYAKMCVGPFHPLPIPIWPGFAPEDDEWKGSRCVEIVYAGDARREKGYHLLPDLVAALEAPMRAGRLRWRIQSNLNMPGGEAGCGQARARLLDWPVEMVRLLLEPLDTQSYRRLILHAQAVLIPYDALAYRARSSGIFAEAMAAGLPCIVPDDTWMAAQWDGLAERDRPGVVFHDAGAGLAETVDRLVRDYDAFRSAARAFSKQWSQWHNPTRLCLEMQRLALAGAGDQ